jgi:predicted DNA-binding transcriptional regulator YafY
MVRWLREVLDPASARAAIDGAPEPDEEGWVELTIAMEHYDHAARSLLYFGDALEVLEPKELRERMAEVTAAMSARYAVA